MAESREKKLPGLFSHPKARGRSHRGGKKCSEQSMLQRKRRKTLK